MNLPALHFILLFITELLLLFPVSSLSASVRKDVPIIKGVPGIKHFTEDDYHSDSQFWTMAEGDDGILYFGNNDGINVFDGERWQLIKLPNGSTVRSMFYSSDGNLYASGYNEIGIVEKDSPGKYSYKSLTGLLQPENRNFDEIWDIHEVQGYIVFRSFQMLIAITGNKATTIPTETIFRYSNVINGKLYVADEWGIKLLDLVKLEFSNIIPGVNYNHEEVSGILPASKGDELIIFSKQGHSYIMNMKENRKIAQNYHFLQNSSDQIYCVIKASNDIFYLGTINSQVHVYQFVNGVFTLKRKIKNLQNSTVLNLFETSDGNIWGMLNKGIDCIEVASPFTHLFENVAIYDAEFFKGKFYLATNQGVYVTPLSPNEQYISTSDFTLVNGLEAQAWSITLIDDKLFIGHDRGVFVLDGSNIDYVENTIGIWKVIPVNERPELFLACAYNGMHLIRKTDAGYTYEGKIADFNVSSRDILPANEPGVFWVCHGYEGVYRVKINKDYTRAISIEHFDEQHGLPSRFNINVSTWKSDTIFTTKNGVFTFDSNKNRFIVQDELSHIFGTDKIVRKVMEENDKTWFILDDALGYFLTDGEEHQLHQDYFLPLKGSFIKSMEYILPFQDQQVLVGTINGLYLIDYSKNKGDKQVKTIFTEVRFKNQKDSTQFAPLSTSVEEPLILPNNTTSLKFNFAAPGFGSQNDVYFSYKLESLDKNWSQWDQDFQKDYSYLKSGNYVFKVRSRSLMSGVSDEISYAFTILPKWYQAKTSRFIFTIIGILIILFIILLVKRKIKKTRVEERKLRKVLELELEQIRLEQEKEKILRDKVQLEGDVINKSMELANYTMLLVQKRGLLSEMLIELKELKDSIKNDRLRNIIRNLTKKINLNLQDEEHLQVFDTNFERVHQDFFNELKSNFSDLTQKELRLCGFVKMNLSNKEIASILNISVRGVETARYRLRKKLSLSQNENTVEFLEKLSSASHEIPVNEADEM